MDYSVHVGFGFHVNCYHSYRGDTCDELGFGSDIRTIRHIIHTLNVCNAEGIPVKGTWDFENAYSLEKILPQYAPDIIEEVRMRMKLYGDENILMGYNNGAMSAMTEDEFMASVKWAVTNEHGSGLKDIFGTCENIIRPQEMMFTPSEAELYQKAGIEAVCLYYSCVSFDAFRTIVPQLTLEQAYNPITYSYKNGSITILPTYSHADVMDAGGLRRLVTDLHDKQEKGDIQNDVFLFVNMDADSFLWEPFPVPERMKKLPCFGGIEGLIREISDLSYIRFDTPGAYLKGHKPVGKVFFGEDVADGNFSGYSSWSEKPFNRLIWTRLERTRMYARLYGNQESPSFEDRVRLLSTTHFGLASPVLNLTREQKAFELSEVMMQKEEEALRIKWEQKKHKVREHEVWIKNVNASSLIGTQLMLDKGFCTDISSLKIKGKRLLKFFAIATDTWEDGSVRCIYILCRFENIKRKYRLHFKVKSVTVPEIDNDNDLAHEILLEDAEGFRLCRNMKTGMPEFYTADGNLLAKWYSRINYDDKLYHFDKPKVEQVKKSGAGKCISFSGEIHLPKEEEPGEYRFCFFIMEGESGIYLLSKIKYPYTMESELAASQAFNLGRCFDMAWNETVPMELTLALDDSAVIKKRNFMNDISGYHISDFWETFWENRNIDSFNHHLTGGMLAVHDEKRGIVLAHARQVCGSMAHCPMRLKSVGEKSIVSMNPFGTYDGKQRYYPTKGNGSVAKLYEAVMPQAASLAPAYNGATEMCIQQISDYYGGDDKKLTNKRKQDIQAFADGCVVYAVNGAIRRFKDDNVTLHEPKTINVDKKKLPLIPTIRGKKSSLICSVIGFIKNIRNFT